MPFRPSEDGVEKGLSVEEQREERVRTFHRELRGHRRAPWWPNVPKSKADLAICETPRDHDWQEPVKVKIGKRPYQLEVVMCSKCPTHLTDVVLVND